MKFLKVWVYLWVAYPYMATQVTMNLKIDQLLKFLVGWIMARTPVSWHVAHRLASKIVSYCLDRIFDLRRRLRDDTDSLQREIEEDAKEVDRLLP